MEKKPSQGIPASSFLVASHHLSWPSFLPVTRRGRERETGIAVAERGEGGPGLASWATRAFLNCIPACVATSRFTHACMHIRAHVYAAHTYIHKRTRTKEDSIRSRLLGGGVHPRKYSGQYIPSFFLLFRPPPHFPVFCFSPSVYRLVLSFLRRHVRETLHSESSQFRVFVA